MAANRKCLARPTKTRDTVGGINAALAEQFNRITQKYISNETNFGDLLHTWWLRVEVQRHQRQLRLTNYVSKPHCPQLAQEAQGVSSRAAHRCRARRIRSAPMMQSRPALPVVVFWPAAFLVGGDGPRCRVGKSKGSNGTRSSRLQFRSAVAFSFSAPVKGGRLVSPSGGKQQPRNRHAAANASQPRRDEI